MATATMTTRPAAMREPKLTDDPAFVTSLADWQDCNREVDRLDVRWKDVQRIKGGDNPIAISDALVEERALRDSIPRAKAKADVARRAHGNARTIALGPIAVFHRDRIRQANDSVFADLRRLLAGAWVDRERALDAAAAAGVQSGSQGREPLALLEMFFDVVGTAESNLRRSDFLS